MTDVVRVVSDHPPALRILLQAASLAGVEAEVTSVRARLAGTTLLLLRARGTEAAALWLTALARYAPDARAIVLLPARVGTAPSGAQVVAVVRDGRHVLRTLVDVCRLALGGRRPEGLEGESRPAVLRAAALGLGHEVANPAAAIATNLEILRADVDRLAELPPGVRASSLRAAVPDWQLAIAESLEACRRVVGLVRQVNGLARDEPDPKPCELDPALATATRLLGRTFRARGRLATRLGAPGVRVGLDPSGVLGLVGELVLRVGRALADLHAPPVRLLLATSQSGAHAELTLELTSEAGAPLEPPLALEDAEALVRSVAPGAQVSRDARVVSVALPIVA